VLQGEQLTLRVCISAAAIFLGVGLVLTAELRKKRRQDAKFAAIR